MQFLRGGPMDGHAVKPEDATGLTIIVQEQPGLNVAMTVGKLIPIKPTTPVAVVDGRKGTYELSEDGDYHWRGWNEA